MELNAFLSGYCKVKYGYVAGYYLKCLGNFKIQLNGEGEFMDDAIIRPDYLKNSYFILDKEQKCIYILNEDDFRLKFAISS